VTGRWTGSEPVEPDDGFATYAIMTKGEVRADLEARTTTRALLAGGGVGAAGGAVAGATAGGAGAVAGDISEKLLCF